MKLTDLRVNHVEEPLGFQLKPVSFSWVVTEPGTAKKQKAVRIRVFENKETIFDSGYDEKADNRDYPAELSLKPKTRYTWSVEVMADNGETAEAESWFETGKMEEPWTGKWITPELDPAIQPILRKKFTVIRNSSVKSKHKKRVTKSAKQKYKLKDLKYVDLTKG